MALFGVVLPLSSPRTVRFLASTQRPDLAPAHNAVNLRAVACAAIGVLWLFLSLAAPVMAQVIPQGITQWSTQIKAGPVLIDMATGNMMVNIAARNKAGAIPFSFNLMDNMNNQGAVNSYNSFLWAQSSGGMTSSNSPNHTICGQPNNYSQKYSAGLTPGWSVTDGTGANHPFIIWQAIIVGTNALGCGGVYGPITAVAADGSGYTAIVTGSSDPNGQLTFDLYNKDGMSYSGGMASLGTLKDADGNTISTSALTCRWRQCNSTYRGLRYARLEAMTP